MLEYARNGNRSRFEAARDRRRNKLQSLVVAECVEGKGRFVDEIANGVWLISEETFWGVPAHLGAQKAGVGLPDVSEPIVELFSAETASLLAWTLYLLEPQLGARIEAAAGAHPAGDGTAHPDAVPHARRFRMDGVQRTAAE